MNASLKQVIWLAPERDGPLLMSALCGDELMAPKGGGEWLRPTRVSRGTGVIMLTYEGEGGDLAFCAIAPAGLSAEWVVSLRYDLGVVGAERRWGPFVGSLGRYQSVATIATPNAWIEAAVVHDGALWRVRRPRHPSALIDRLSQRDRIEGEQNVRAAFDLPPLAHPLRVRGANALEERGRALHEDGRRG